MYKPKKQNKLSRFYGLPGAPKVHKRLDRDRTKGLSQPKVGVRELDEDVLNWCRNRGVCEYCQSWGPTEPSHLESRGSGGSDNFDNVIASCRKCHNEYHSGEIGIDSLQYVVKKRPQPGESMYGDYMNPI